MSLSPPWIVSRIDGRLFFFFFTHDFSLFADTTLLTPQGTECAPITCIEKVNLSDFFEKLPYTYTSKCKLCGRIVSNLKNHYLTHNPGNYVCPLCGCRRTRLDNLKGHIKQKHPEIQILQKPSGSGQTWTESNHIVFLPFLHHWFLNPSRLISPACTRGNWSVRDI